MAANQEYNIWPWLRDTQGIKTIIDVGANDGSFAAFMSRHFKAESVYAFEPLPACIPEIEKNLAGVPDLKIFNTALSDHNGVETLYVNSYAPASSLMRVSGVSMAEFPQTIGETPITVKVGVLDELIDADKLKRNVLLKLDVQGMEDKVIAGGRKVFLAAKCVLVEMSFIEMYDGQPLFEEIHALLAEMGFRFAGIKNQIHSQKTGQPLFCHCLYVRQ
jgi:FkbM family methyltransferase